MPALAQGEPQPNSGDNVDQKRATLVSAAKA